MATPASVEVEEEMRKENAHNPPVAMSAQQHRQQQQQQQQQQKKKKKKKREKEVSDLFLVLGIEPAPADPKDTRTAGLKAHASSTWPSIIDILGRLPRPASMASQAKQNRSSGGKVAVCSTGHLRTFSLPGMYSSLSKHLLQSAPGSADLYLVGHLGAFRGSDDAHKTVQMDGPATADDALLTQARGHLGLSGDHVEHTSGDCTALEESWARDGITGRVCTDNGNFMQMMWLDHCVHMVRNSGKHYDLLVRMRPDVGIFQPFPWDTLSDDHVTYMQKDAGGKVDWFFTVPWSTIDTWWDPVAAMYATGFGGLPDYSIFSHSEMLVERNFPVVIVRGIRSAQCWRIVTSSKLQSDCEQKTGSGFWEQLHP